jgi:hypothetical protein
MVFCGERNGQTIFMVHVRDTLQRALEYDSDEDNKSNDDDETLH